MKTLFDSFQPVEDLRGVGSAPSFDRDARTAGATIVRSEMPSVLRMEARQRQHLLGEELAAFALAEDVDRILARGPDIGSFVLKHITDIQLEQLLTSSLDPQTILPDDAGVLAGV